MDPDQPADADTRTRGRDLHLFYFYDLPLPCDLAAPIQILRTVRGIAELGTRVTVCANRIEGEDPKRCLGYYGLETHANLELRSFFPVRLPVPLKPRLERLLAGAGRRTVLMSRGETGVALYRAIRGLRTRRAVFVYEAHRLGFENQREIASSQPPIKAPLHSLRIARTRRRERLAVEGADALVCLTRGVRTALTERFDVAGTPTLVLPSGTHCRSVESLGSYDNDQRDIDILYAGKLIDRKGVRLLVSALALMPEAKGCVVGGTATQCRSFREAARARGISDDRLRLPGYVRPAEIHAWYDRAKLGVCPLPGGESLIAERYSSPMKVLEMMAAGVPVVASDLPSTREILRHDHTALLVPPNRPDLLAAAAQRVLSDPALADRLRQQALDEVHWYCWPKRAQRLLEFITTLPSVDHVRPARGDQHAP